MSVQSVRRAKKDFDDQARRIMHLVKHPGKKLTGDVQCDDLDFWLGSIPYSIVEVILASGAKAKIEAKRSDFRGFVNYVLTDADKEKYKEWDIDDHDLFLLLAGDLQSGYKFSSSYNKQNDTYSATYTCHDDTSPNVGYALSAYAPDLYHAMRSLVFKHNVILDCVWSVDKVKDQAKWG